MERQSEWRVGSDLSRLSEKADYRPTRNQFFERLKWLICVFWIVWLSPINDITNENLKSLCFIERRFCSKKESLILLFFPPDPDSCSKIYYISQSHLLTTASAVFINSWQILSLGRVIWTFFALFSWRAHKIKIYSNYLSYFFACMKELWNLFSQTTSS